MTSCQVLANEIRIILKENTSLQYDETLNKVKCSLSGHEMPCNIDQIKLYVNGKKYKKLKDRQEKAFENYRPHIVPNIKEGQQHQLFCLLTRRNINKSIEHVERHVNGAKYKKALKKWEDKKASENGDEAVGQETDGEKCLIEEEDDEEEEEEEEEEEDLEDLYPDIAEQVENDVDDEEENDMDESEEENSARNEKPAENEASSSKRKSDSADSGSGSKRKRQRKKKPK